MSIFGNKNDDSIIEQKRRYSGGIGSRVNFTRKFCKRSSDLTRVSCTRKAQERMKMEHILKLFGYKEKTANALEVIKHACFLNVEAEERIKKVRATLDGEDNWFKGEDGDLGSNFE